MTSLTEELASVARSAADGDRAAQARLFRQLYPVVHKHLSLLLGFHPVVEDAVQESIAQIYRALPTFRGEAAPTTWALTIAARTARRQWRRELRRCEPSGEIDVAVFDTDQTSASEALLLSKALSRLKPKKREAFVLMAIFEMSASEAAEVLGTSQNTAASRYRHARLELIRYYAHAEGDTGLQPAAEGLRVKGATGG